MREKENVDACDQYNLMIKTLVFQILRELIEEVKDRRDKRILDGAGLSQWAPPSEHPSGGDL